MKREGCGCGKVLVRGERGVKVWVKRVEREVFLVLDEEGKAYMYTVQYKGLDEGSI